MCFIVHKTPQLTGLDRRWRRNMVLNKWLDYLRDQGHLVLER